ncbi:acyltransferase [Bradyrhizobium liaoningense]|uniref:acyltransferase family protein n=1 Tax=Bradyrhizobium liaoningense TaxID=43992 RepID=UPI001BADF118|nr:acyltransferase [Bradyrhizobium liaoningense]MBR0742248.1 acyltransferase [Bradyrhizobium liaoningense]
MGLLRLLLALAVVGDHVLPPFPWLRLTTGIVAVQIFFVVSGFYMQMVLSQRYASAGAFYFSRAIRIFPTYWVVAALSLALWPVNGLQSIANLGWQPAALILASNALIFLQDTLLFLGAHHGDLFFTADFHATVPQLSSYLVVRPSWTLALELYFYLMAPFLARLGSLQLGAIALILTGARLVAYHAGLDNDPWLYRFFPFELPLFVLGMLSFRLFNRIEPRPAVKSKAVALAAIAGLIVMTQCFALNVPTEYNFLAAATAAAVVPLAFAAFKDVSMDRFIGDLSFPIYLVHFPVIQFVSNNYVDAVAISLSASCVIVLGLERPLDRLRHRYAGSYWNRNKPMLSAAAKADFGLADAANQRS